MTDTMDTARKTPWHFWLVAVIAVLWNAFGAYDYLMSQMKGDAYLTASGMNAAQIAYFHAMPAWTIGAWAVGVWGAVAGTVLLLLRSRFALHAFVASLAGLLASLVYGYLLSDGSKVMGAQGAIMNGVILAGCLFFVWYAWLMGKRGVIR